MSPDNEKLSNSEKNSAFYGKNTNQRAAIVLAGPGANFLLSIIVFFMLFCLVGKPFTPPVIDKIEEGSPAHIAGIQSGDKIISVNGKSVMSFEDLTEIFMINPDKNLKVSVLREEITWETEIVPKSIKVKGIAGTEQNIGVVGISPYTPSIIGSLVSGGPAEKAGLLKGDIIKKIDGINISTFQDISKILSNKFNEEIIIEVIRNNKKLEYLITPYEHKVLEDNGLYVSTGRIGVVSEHRLKKLPIIKSAIYSVLETYSISIQTLIGIKDIIIGKRDRKEIGGPIMIAQVSGMVAKNGFIAILGFMALLSINLGLINLFPIPMLDGGHFLFILIEKIKGSPLTKKVQEYALYAGLTIVILLMLFAMANDLNRPDNIEFLRKLI